MLQFNQVETCGDAGPSRCTRCCWQTSLLPQPHVAHPDRDDHVHPCHRQLLLFNFTQISHIRRGRAHLQSLLDFQNWNSHLPTIFSAMSRTRYLSLPRVKVELFSTWPARSGCQDEGPSMLQLIVSQVTTNHHPHDHWLAQRSGHKRSLQFSRQLVLTEHWTVDSSETWFLSWMKLFGKERRLALKIGLSAT